MKKTTRYLEIIFILVVLLALFAACTLNGGKKNQNEEQEIDKGQLLYIEVDLSSVPTNVYAGKLVLSKIKLDLYYENGERETVDLKEEYINVAGLNKLSQPGVQVIDVVYGTCRSSFTVVLLDPGKVQYSLVVRGGVPVSVNGDPVNYFLTENAFSGEFDAGSVVEIRWLEEEGRVFDSWTVGRDTVDTQAKTSVTMNADYEYVAHSVEFTYTVTFVTYNQTVNVAQIKAKRIENESDIAREMTMENYDFVGWTTQQISQTEATSGTFAGQLVTFPYAIEQNVTFFAVWTPIGFSYTTFSTTYGGRNVEGKQIVSYTGTLTNLTIPAKSDGQDVIAIAKDAFSQDNAKLLTRIFIPSSIVSIEEGAFRNCTSVESFEVDETSASSPFRAERGILYNSTMTVLFSYPLGNVAAKVSVKSTVQEICEYAFHDAMVGVVEIPSDMVRIGSHAFDSSHIDHVDFSRLKCAKIRNNVGEDVFNKYLDKIVVDTEQSEIDGYRLLFAEESDKVVNSLSSDIRYVYASKTEDDVTILFRLIMGTYFDIGSARTAEILGINRSIREIALPDTIIGTGSEYIVTSIAEYAFSDCILLESVVLPAQLERVCDYAFDDTPWAQGLDKQSIVANNTLYKYLGRDEVYELGEEIRRIAEGAFRGNTTLRNVDITANTALTRIDAYAFSGCTALRGFAAGATETVFLIKPALTTIAPYAFEQAAFLGIETQATALGEAGGLTTVSAFAFADNHRLLYADLLVDALSLIDTQALLRCYSLSEVNVSAGNAAYVSYDGILYRKGENEAVSLFYYPSGKMKDVLDPNRPTDGVILNVVSFGDYCLQYPNVGGLVIEESVTDISANAINAPALTYIRFTDATTLHNQSYLNFVADEDAAVGNVGVTFVFNEALPASLRNGFFGSEALALEHSTTTTPCDLYVQNGILYAVSENGTLSVVGASRQEEVLSVPSVVHLGGDTFASKNIRKYAFTGYYLRTLSVNGVRAFDDYALSDAFVLEMLELLETEPESIPSIATHSLGERFNDGLLIAVSCDPAEADSFFDKWSQFIDVFTFTDVNGALRKGSEYVLYGDPYVVLTYRDKDNESHTSSVEVGSVNEAHIRSVNGKKPGYSVGRWFDVNAEAETYIDLYDGYDIPYNMVLECEWIADVYEIVFLLPEGVTPDFTATYVETNNGISYYTTQLEFGSAYSYEIVDENRNAYEFNGWMLDETLLAPVSTWTEVLENGTCQLSPARAKRKYTIKYSVEDGVVIGATEATVYYNEQYRLVVPQKNGYRFLGWQIKSGSSYIVLTGDNGASLSEWRIAATDAVSVYPLWREIEVDVVLKLDEIDVYGSAKIPFNSSSYVLPMDSNEIAASVYGKYASKIEFFAGWQDADGKIYTTADGLAIRNWDKYVSTVLYAVWPEFIADADALIAAVAADNKVSVVLTDDITIDSQLSEEYNGVFNGNGHTVRFASTGEYAFVGDNNGTIKNVVFDATLSVSMQLVDGDVNLGILCKRNTASGSIENVVLNVDRFDVVVTEASNTYSCIGGICGVNYGSIRIVTENVRHFSFAVAQTDGILLVGTAVGENDGECVFSLLNIQSMSVTVAGEPFGGERASIGSVFGLMQSGGSVSGNVRYAVSAVEDPFDVYVDATEKAAASSDKYVAVAEEDLELTLAEEGSLLSGYESYYVKDGSEWKTADRIYNAEETYYYLEWDRVYTSYYAYDEEYCLRGATKRFISGITYYEISSSTSDYFSKKAAIFGIDNGGESQNLLFSAIGK